MKRYHKSVYFPPSENQVLIKFIENINTLPWSVSTHAFDNLKYRVVNLEAALRTIQEKLFGVDEVFEYYTDNSGIVKACFRFEWDGGNDIIVVVGLWKRLITAYLNGKDDNHCTLNRSLYVLPLS